MGCGSGWFVGVVEWGDPDVGGGDGGSNDVD